MKRLIAGTLALAGGLAAPAAAIAASSLTNTNTLESAASQASSTGAPSRSA